MDSSDSLKKRPFSSAVLPGHLKMSSSCLADPKNSSTKQEKLAALKSLLTNSQGIQSRDRRHFSMSSDGLPNRCLIEISGNGKTDYFINFLKEHPSLQTVWVEESLSINPYALWQQGLSLSSILFVECSEKKNSLTSASEIISQLLKSQLFQVFVLSEIIFDENHLRKFQLLIEKFDGHIFLLSPLFHKSWVPALKIQIREGQGFFIKGSSSSSLSDPKRARAL